MARRAQAAVVNKGDGRNVPFAENSHLKSLSLLRTPTQSKANWNVITQDGSNSFKVFANSCRETLPSRERRRLRTASPPVIEARRLRSASPPVQEQKAQKAQKAKIDNNVEVMNVITESDVEVGEDCWGDYKTADGIKQNSGNAMPQEVRVQKGSEKNLIRAETLPERAAADTSSCIALTNVRRLPERRQMHVKPAEEREIIGARQRSKAPQSKASVMHSMHMASTSNAGKWARGFSCRCEKPRDCDLPTICSSVNGNMMGNSALAASSSVPIIRHQGGAFFKHYESEQLQRKRRGRVPEGAQPTQIIMLPAAPRLGPQGLQGRVPLAAAASPKPMAPLLQLPHLAPQPQPKETLSEIKEAPMHVSSKSSTSSTMFGSPALASMAETARIRTQMQKSSSRGFYERAPEIDEDEVMEDIRQMVRFSLVEVTGSPLEAFQRLDLSRSGRLSFSEFSSGLALLEIPWQEATGLRKDSELFRIFDVGKQGFLTLAELFPEAKGSTKTTRPTTTNFWHTWCEGTTNVGAEAHCLGGPRWVSKEGDLQTVMDMAQTMHNVSDKRRWIASTVHRMKREGKSDAKSREICASHLPKGTGPKDGSHDVVNTFSDVEVKTCQAAYNEQMERTLHNIQKSIFDMSEQRLTLHNSRQMLLECTGRPEVVEVVVHAPVHNPAAEHCLGLGLGERFSASKQAVKHDQSRENQFGDAKYTKAM